MLGRLCQALDADPGGWFRWQGDELAWNVQTIAEARGMTLQDVVWAAEILPNALGLIWRGAQQFIFVATLGRLARALRLEIGDLFEWKAERTEGERGQRTED